MTLQAIIYLFLGWAYCTFATMELKSTLVFALSPGQGNCVGAVAAQPNRIPRCWLLAEENLTCGHRFWGLHVSNRDFQRAPRDQGNFNRSLYPVSSASRHLSSVILWLHSRNWIAQFTAAIKAFLKNNPKKPQKKTARQNSFGVFCGAERIHLFLAGKDILKDT